LVPEQDLSVQILTNDGVLGRRFENSADEFNCLLSGRYDGAIEEAGPHYSLLFLIRLTHRQRIPSLIVSWPSEKNVASGYSAT